MNERNGIGFCAWGLFGGLKELDIGIEKWVMRSLVEEEEEEEEEGESRE